MFNKWSQVRNSVYDVCSKTYCVYYVSLNLTGVYTGYKRVSMLRGFPGGTVVKNPPASAGDTGSSPGLGRSHMARSN